MKDIFPPNNKRSIRNISSPRGNNNENVKKENEDYFGFKREKVRDLKRKQPGSSNDTKREQEEFEGKFTDKGVNDLDNNKMGMRAANRERKWLWWLLGGLLAVGFLAVVGFGISYQFATAEIFIKPTGVDAKIDETLELVRKDPSSDPEGRLSFDLITINQESPESAPVEISGTEEVKEKASGEITIYNEFSQDEQVLVENTRFESPEGLVFRIPQSVTVPGMRNDEPGTVKSEVHADEFGDEYNIGPTEFTIPGFEDSPRFEGFYAVSDSSMTGGEIGEKPVVEDQSLDSIRKDLRVGVEEELLSLARNSVPDDFILFDGLYSIIEREEINTEEEEALLVLDDLLVGILLEESEVAQYLYERAFEENFEIEVKDWSGLSFSLRDDELSEESESVTVDVSGDVRFFRKIEKDTLRSDISGLAIKDKEAIEEVLDSYPVDQVQVEVKPFWVRSLPRNPDNIFINIRY